MTAIADEIVLNAINICNRGLTEEPHEHYTLRLLVNSESKDFSREVAAAAVALHTLLDHAHEVRLVIKPSVSRLTYDGPSALGEPVPVHVRTFTLTNRHGNAVFGYISALHRVCEIVNNSPMPSPATIDGVFDLVQRHHLSSGELRCPDCQKFYPTPERYSLCFGLPCRSCRKAEERRRPYTREAITDWDGPVLNGLNDTDFHGSLEDLVEILELDGHLDAAREEGFPVYAHPCVVKTLSPDQSGPLFNPRDVASFMIEYWMEWANNEYMPDDQYLEDVTTAVDGLELGIAAAVENWLQDQNYTVWEPKWSQVIWIYNPEEDTSD